VSEQLRLIEPRSERFMPTAEGAVNASCEQNCAKDDLSRNVYGLLGIPVDGIDFSSLLQRMSFALQSASPFLISTPNVNFLIKSQRNSEFRESILQSNLCLPDGMPLIWIAKLLRIPIVERIAGADLFGRLQMANAAIRPVRVFLLGGADGVGEKVRDKLNSQKCGMECVGVLNPGYGSIEDMSTAHVIETINLSKADLLAVFFGAEKAQAWLMHNHESLDVPLRAQFGATINFEAGTVRRAPKFLRSTGFEWLWRIKEEPYLWRRYWNDGTKLLWLLLTCVLPLSIKARRSAQGEDLVVREREEPDSLTLFLSGAAVAMNVDKATSAFRRALSSNKKITIDLSKASAIDPRFFGLLLMMQKQLAGDGRVLNFAAVTPKLQKIFRRNRFEFLLSGHLR
jgi:N-acetylglucosaminyldiphosphoundecaprenol N-acetyl-beta-D-mannosaminyltransferase